MDKSKLIKEDLSVNDFKRVNDDKSFYSSNNNEINKIREEVNYINNDVEQNIRLEKLVKEQAHKIRELKDEK